MLEMMPVLSITEIGYRPINSYLHTHTHTMHMTEISADENKTPISEKIVIFQITTQSVGPLGAEELGERGEHEVTTGGGWEAAGEGAAEAGVVVSNCCRISAGTLPRRISFSRSKLPILSMRRPIVVFSTSTSSRTAKRRCDFTRSIACSILLSMGSALPVSTGAPLLAVPVPEYPLSDDTVVVAVETENAWSTPLCRAAVLLTAELLTADVITIDVLVTDVLMAGVLIIDILTAELRSEGSGTVTDSSTGEVT